MLDKLVNITSSLTIQLTSSSLEKSKESLWFRRKYEEFFKKKNYTRKNDVNTQYCYKEKYSST